MSRRVLVSLVTVSLVSIPLVFAGLALAAEKHTLSIALRHGKKALGKGWCEVDGQRYAADAKGWVRIPLAKGVYRVKCHSDGFTEVTRKVTIKKSKRQRWALTTPPSKVKEMVAKAKLLGALQGDAIGMARGVGGLGIKGSGRGGGGYGKGAIGLGNVGTVGRGGASRSGYGRGPSASYSVRRVAGLRSHPRGDSNAVQQHNTEDYDHLGENPFTSPSVKALSTFGIDVDTASYANMRRFIESGRMPPKDAIRVEELINYFTYDYPEPTSAHPFGVNSEISVAPWNTDHRLVHIGVQGKRLKPESLPPSNLVFLLDVSGSMNRSNKLPLLKRAFRMLVDNLQPHDRVAIVVYAGAAGLVLPSTPGKRKGEILAAIDQLRAGGSTAGGAGIKLAYKIAREHFVKGGNNRIILATDGDFNVGTSGDGALVRLIEQKRKTGVFLTILGFGRGNYKDAKMEKLSNAGNGNAAYIDSILEAKKVLVKEMGGTLHTIAKDVKIQVEFNPAKVKGYRLIGYVNRKLKAQDFNDDKKDAGELGAGHSVTVLYEIIPAGSEEEVPGVDPLKYQKAVTASSSDELMTVKLRYKKPDGDKSTLITQPLLDRGVTLAATSNDFRFSAAVASFGMLLRDSKHKGDTSFERIQGWARKASGADAEGYRHDFVKLVQKAALHRPSAQVAR